MEVTPDGDTLGSGAVVADAAGVLAIVASGVLTPAASPWPVEWVGKLEAWRLAETLGVALAAVQYVGADCTSATLGGDGGVPCQSPWVDSVRVTFAEAIGRSQLDLYVPAQHNTQWSGLLSDLQAHAHDLAALGPGTVQGHVPAPEGTGRDGLAVLIAPPGDSGPARDGPLLRPAGGPIRDLRPAWG